MSVTLIALLRVNACQPVWQGTYSVSAPKQTIGPKLLQALIFEFYLEIAFKYALQL